MSEHFWEMPYPSQRQPVLAGNVVATSQPLAAQAGLAVLRGGGNAVEAAVAAAAVMAVYFIAPFASIRIARSCGAFATDRLVCTFVAFPYRNSSQAATKSDHDPRGSLGSQKPYIDRMTCDASIGDWHPAQCELRYYLQPSQHAQPHRTRWKCSNPEHRAQRSPRAQHSEPAISRPACRARRGAPRSRSLSVLDEKKSPPFARFCRALALPNAPSKQGG